MAVDRTYLAVRRQLRAMGAEQYEIGIRDQNGRMLTRVWTEAEALKAVPWLKRQNAKGADVYVRPAGEQNAGVVLVDDLNQAQIQRMKAEGLAPAAVVETSPFNFQAWVRISEQPLAPVVATAASKALAETYGGDPNSADWRHFGRLAGFTNRKPEHVTATGRSSYVLAHASNGKMAARGPQIVQEAQERVRQGELRVEQEKRLRAAQEASERVYGHDPVREYRRQLRRLLERYGAAADLSRLDWMITKDMALQGYSSQELVQALTEASPELPKRKGSHEPDYIRRTVAKVLAEPEVQERQRELVRQRGRERGLER